MLMGYSVEGNTGGIVEKMKLPINPHWNETGGRRIWLDKPQ
jgi:hypothetical protein